MRVVLDIPVPGSTESGQVEKCLLVCSTRVDFWTVTVQKGKVAAYEDNSVRVACRYASVDLFNLK